MRWIFRHWMYQLKSLPARRKEGRMQRQKKKATRLVETSYGKEYTELLEEIRVAHLEWECAQHRLDHVVTEDEIDYAIFALETAEKRYSMLLKRAKAIRANVKTSAQAVTAGVGQTIGG